MAVSIQVTTNAADVNRWLLGKNKKIMQAGKAALSQTVLQIQKAEQAEVRKELTVRKSAFINNRIKIFRFPKATADGLVAVIGINDKVQGTPLFLAQFEEGGERVPRSGGSVAVPITGSKARVNFRKNVPASLRINTLALKKAGGEIKGSKRTVILPSGGGHVLFQRQGKGSKSTLVPLYVFKRKPMLKKRLQFVKIAKDLADYQLPILFNRYLRLYVKD